MTQKFFGGRPERSEGRSTTPDRSPTDVRLALGTGLAWLALALCVGRSPIAVLAIALGAVAIGLLGIMGPRRIRAVGGPLAAAGFCVALVLVPFAGRLWQARASPLMMLAAQHTAVTAELTVSGDPHTLAATGVAGVPRVSVATDADGLEVAGRHWAVSGPVLVLAPAQPWGDVLPGQRVRLDGTLQPSLDAGSTGATLFAEQPPHLVGTPPWWQRAAGRVRAGLRQASAVLPNEERGLLPGLVDGDTNGLDPVLVQRFRIAGLTHLVAVSGTNCSIMIGTVLLVLRRARVRPWVCGVAGAVVLIAFVLVARPSPSVLRAALMAAITLASLAAGRPRQAVPALAATVLGLLVWDPALATDAGFTMSALATAALLFIAPGWAAALRRRRVPFGLAEAVAVAAAAHVVTAPVIAAISGRVSLVSIPANVLAEPVVAPATMLGFGAALVAPAWLGGAQTLAWIAGWPCRWLVWVADRAGGLAGASLAWPGGAAGGLALLAVLLAIAFLVRHRGIWRLLAIGAVVAMLAQIPIRSLPSGWPPPGWVMVACDIGQGDAIVLAAGSGAAVEIDAGPDPVAVDRCLRDLGIDDVALLVFSHYHLDHVGGIAGVFHDRRVERVITGPLAEPVSGVILVHRVLAQHGLTISTPAPGAILDVGRVHLEVLAPLVAFHDTRSDPNNSSLVLRATIGDVRIMLPGDVEVEAQQSMLAAGTDVRADVLKVPHHGSAYSDPDFLAGVHARVGVISVGLNNDYGHPSPILLTEMARLGVPVRRTDLDGDVAVVGPSAGLTTVVRGTKASVGGGEPATAPSAPGRGRAAPSAAGARMVTWQPSAQFAPSHSTICPSRCRPSSCWSATRNCSSPGPSARSPPPSAGATPT
jgi:competence protein ComEC